MSENNVLALLQQTHAADSALGALGATSGSVSDIKEYGRMILREHHALGKDALQLAHALGFAPETPRVAPDEPSASVRQALSSATAGAAWDRMYVEYAIAVHEAAMENTARALAATRRPEVKQYIEKSVPILQKHIDKARSLQKSLARVPKDTAKSGKR